MRKTKIRTLRFGEVRLWECRSPQVKFSGGDRQVPRPRWKTPPGSANPGAGAPLLAASAVWPALSAALEPRWLIFETKSFELRASAPFDFLLEFCDGDSAPFFIVRGALEAPTHFGARNPRGTFATLGEPNST